MAQRSGQRQDGEKQTRSALVCRLRLERTANTPRAEINRLPQQLEVTEVFTLFLAASEAFKTATE